KTQSAWWFLLECISTEEVRAMVNDTASPSEAWRALSDHFFPLTDAQINLHEHKLLNLRMHPGQDPHVFFSAIKRTVGALLMLGVKKEERQICSVMLDGLPQEYDVLR
ncbi:unnamed protein product, partial [Sphacelaria rigidula]